MGNRWVILSVLFFARMTMAFQFQSIATLAPLYADSHGASVADIGLLIGLYLAPGAAIALPGSVISARFGERRVVFLSMVLMLLGGAMAGLSGDWHAVVAGRLIAGIGGVTINVVMTKLLADWFVGREISTAMGIYINSWPVGIGASLLILPSVAADGGLASATLVTLSLIALGLMLFALFHRAPDHGASAAPRPVRAKLPLVALLLAAAVWALYNAAIVLVIGFGPTLLTTAGWTLAAASSTTSLFIIGIAVSVPLGGILADRTGRRDAIVVAGQLGFAVLLVLALTTTSVAVIAIFALMGLVAGLAGGPIISMPSLILAPEARAFGMGLYFSVYYAAMMAVPTAAGRVAEAAGDVGVAFALGAGILAASILATGLFRRSAPRLPAVVSGE